MDRSPLASRIALAAVFASTLVCADARAVRRTEDPLALIPADAATVGVVHWNELKETPLGARVFADMDHISGDDDGARFFRETGLTPREDIDTITVAMTRSSGTHGSGLVLFEGRFDLARIEKALTSRGATLKKTASGGELYRLPNQGGEEGAVALVNRNLLVCGGEAEVAAALARRESGGEGGLSSGQGLGKQLSRIDQHASAWALVDLTRLPKHDAEASSSSGDGEPSRAVIGAMKSVTLVAIQATVKGDGLDFQATGLTNSADDRQNLEDALRGVLAMWRMAVQDKSPELVSVIRKFQVDSDSEAVSIRGNLPGTFLRSLESKRAQK
jgi:hypothetical protein